MLLIFLVLLIASNATTAYKAERYGEVKVQDKWKDTAIAALQSDVQGLKSVSADTAKIAGDTQTAVGKIRVVNKTINNEVQREIIEKQTQYAVVCLPDSGVVQWNAANKGVVSGASAASKPDAALPGVAGASDPGRQGGDAPRQPH